MKRNFAIIISSLLLLPLWGLTLLSANFANEYTVFCCFLITLLFYVPFRNYKRVYLLLIGPIVYSFLILTFKGLTEIHNPVFILLISLLLLFIRLIQATRFVLFSTIAIVYSFFIYPNLGYGIQKIDSSLVVQNSEILELNLFQFDHLSKLREKISGEESYFLVETWNEVCPPCLKSIKELEDSIHQIKSIHHIYLYQDLTNRRLTDAEIYNFRRIKYKNKIEIDIDNRLYTEMNLGSMPYFILFNKNGNYVDHRKGYSDLLRDDLLKFLKRENG